MKWKLAIPALLWLGAIGYGQDYYPKNDGVKASDENYTALTNARIHVSADQVIDNATLLGGLRFEAALLFDRIGRIANGAVTDLLRRGQAMLGRWQRLGCTSVAASTRSIARCSRRSPNR